MLIQKTLKAQAAYLESLESSDMFAISEAATSKGRSKPPDKRGDTRDAKAQNAMNSEAQVLKACVTELTGLHGKLYGDLTFAKREIAFAKLDAKDLDELFRLFRGILIPLIGTSTITDIFGRIAKRRGWVDTPESEVVKSEKWEQCEQSEREEEKRIWNEIMKTLHEPFEVASTASKSLVSQTTLQSIPTNLY